MFLTAIIVYLAVLLTIGIYKTRSVKTQEDFMVAGRKTPVYKLVGTLLATWIGSGSIIAGAGLAYRVGFSELWLSAGAWVAIVIVYFLAGRVRKISQYTMPDILEQRYNKWARILGTITIVIAYVTIASYQFKGGAFVLNLVAGIPVEQGIIITAVFVVLFTALAGLVSVITMDIINGTLMLLGIVLAVPQGFPAGIVQVMRSRQLIKLLFAFLFILCFQRMVSVFLAGRVG
ncbi:Sodium:solute symporter family protein, partial [Candidatus Kryptonium thompsonii]